MGHRAKVKATTKTVTMSLSPFLYSLTNDPLTPPLRSPSSAPTSALSKASTTSKPSFLRNFLLLFFFFADFLNRFYFFLRIAENDFFKQDWRTRGKIQIFLYIFMKWLLCFLIGGIVSLVGFCNNLAVENIAGVKFVITSNMMLAQRSLFSITDWLNFFFCFNGN